MRRLLGSGWHWSVWTTWRRVFGVQVPLLLLYCRLLLVRFFAVIFSCLRCLLTFLLFQLRYNTFLCSMSRRFSTSSLSTTKSISPVSNGTSRDTRRRSMPSATAASTRWRRIRPRMWYMPQHKHVLGTEILRLFWSSTLTIRSQLIVPWIIDHTLFPY